jgi:hypothetical protein
VKIATWNVNSVRTRVNRVIGFLESSGTDVLAMQEIKCKPDQFPYKAFEDAGYQITMHGLNQWNGVAFASKIPAEDIEIGFSGMPEFKEVQEARAIAATFDGIRLWSLYVPNGRTLDDPHFPYKLEWLDRLAAVTAETLENEPDVPLILQKCAEQTGEGGWRTPVFHILAQELIVTCSNKQMRRWEKKLFGFLSRNVLPGPDYLNIPPDSLIVYNWLLRLDPAEGREVSSLKN